MTTLFVQEQSTGKIIGRASWWLGLKAQELRDACYAVPCGSGRWDYVEDRNADLLKARGMDVRRVSVGLGFDNPF